MKSKLDPVRTLSPDALRNIVYKTPNWELKRGRFHHFFHINRIEDVRPVIKFPTPPHRKTVADFIFVTQGSMVRQLGLSSYHVSTSTFFFLPAHQISSEEWMSEDIRGYYCHIDVAMLAKGWHKPDVELEFSFLRFVGNPLLFIDSELVETVVFLMNRLEYLYQKDQEEDAELLKIYLLTLFTELKKVAPSDGPNRVDDRPNSAALRFTQLYKNALTKHIYTKQNISDYADMLHISPNHLNKCVKVVTGQSAHGLLDEMILLEAKVLLSQTDLSVSEIAYKIGKQEPGNFTRFFRLKTGKTPSDYRTMD